MQMTSFSARRECSSVLMPETDAQISLGISPRRRSHASNKLVSCDVPALAIVRRRKDNALGEDVHVREYDPLTPGRVHEYDVGVAGRASIPPQQTETPRKRRARTENGRLVES